MLLGRPRTRQRGTAATGPCALSRPSSFRLSPRNTTITTTRVLSTGGAASKVSGPSTGATNRPNPFLAETQGHLRTVRDCIRFATTKMRENRVHYGQGSTNAYDDAFWLVYGTLKLPMNTEAPGVFFDAALTPKELERVMNAVQDRVKFRIPTAYITNTALLSNFEFHVDPRVIVPRSLISELLMNEQQLQDIWKLATTPNRVSDCLDLCTGSGSLAIMAANAFPQSKVDAIDISGDALEVAKLNVANYMLEDRVKLIQGDFFSGIPSGKKYDLILCNPPYVTKQKMMVLPPEFKKEPELALFGGDDGMTFVDQLLKEGPKCLKEGGLMIVESGQKRAVIEAKYPNARLHWAEISVGSEDVFGLLKAEVGGSVPTKPTQPRSKAQEDEGIEVYVDEDRVEDRLPRRPPKGPKPPNKHRR